MKINNFLTLFNIRTKNKQLSEEELIQTIAELIGTKQYLPYDDKIKLAIVTINESPKDFPQAPYRNRLFIVNLIKVYTNLEMNITDFDILAENMLVTPILMTFLQEYKICSSIMNMCIAEIGGNDYVGQLE